MGTSTFTLEVPSIGYKKSINLTVDEFLPLVKIKPEKVKDATKNTFEINGDELSDTKEKVTLSKHLDSEKGTFTLQQLTTDKKKIKLSFEITKGSDDSWDDDGYIEPKLSIEDENFKIPSEIKILKKYETEIEVEIELNGKDKKEFYLDFYANDDEDDFNKGEYENVHCGRIKIVKVNPCFCKRELEETDLKRIISELRKQDGVQREQEFASNNLDPIYIVSNGTKLVKKGKTEFYTLDNKEYKGTETPKKHKPLKANFDKIGTTIFQLDNDEKVNASEANLTNFAKELNGAFEKYEINTCIRKIHFLAQCYHESLQFQSTFEQDAITNPSGGKHYAGRGLIQITHNYNYKSLYQDLNGNKPTAQELYNFAPTVAKQLHLAVYASAYFWKNIGAKKGNLNQFADADDILTVSKEINGYKDIPNGYNERVKLTNNLKKIFEYNECVSK